MRGDAGMVTAELAACLPVLVLLLAVGLSAVTAADTNLRVGDLAREAARLAARHDDSGVARLAAVHAGVRLVVTPAQGEVVAVATAQLHPLGGLLPTMEVTGRAVAAVEPEGEP